jgi:hypothetical protein
MDEAIAPLCDNDHRSIEPQNLTIDSAGDPLVLRAYVCKAVSCNRCYSESTGYFDFVTGKLYVSDRQTLCERDACPLFVNCVAPNGEEVWQCPCCNEFRRF